MDVVKEGETLVKLCARLNVPACALMRANGLFSEAWLTPGREIFVPEGDFCRGEGGVCPVQALNTPARSRTG